jgi:quercetin dioxygenase-like cupin family protein
MTRIAMLLALGLMLVGSSYAMQDDPRFTGKSLVMEGKDLSAARRSFEAGARTAWHSHDNGQLLLVEDGRMRTQKKGGPIKELGKGESDYTGPKVIHWHGAVPGQGLIQINVGFGGETQWMDKVTAAEYNAK